MTRNLSPAARFGVILTGIVSTGPRWLLAGDAAGFIDPSSARGIPRDPFGRAMRGCAQRKSWMSRAGKTLCKGERGLHRVMGKYLKFHCMVSPRVHRVFTSPTSAFSSLPRMPCLREPGQRLRNLVADAVSTSCCLFSVLSAVPASRAQAANSVAPSWSQHEVRSSGLWAACLARRLHFAPAVSGAGPDLADIQRAASLHHRRQPCDWRV